jgi:UDP-glucose 4-epimerase
VIYDSLHKGHRDAIPEEATFVKADLSDGAALRAAIGHHHIASVVHMAADSTPYCFYLDAILHGSSWPGNG